MKCEIFKLSRCKFPMCRCTWGGLLNQLSFSFDNWDLFNHLHHEMRYAANCSEVHSRCVSTCERLKDNARWMNSSQPQGAPNTAYQGSEFSFNILAWDSSASFWKASELSWPSDTFIEWSGNSKKKTKQAGFCFGNARKSLLPKDFWHTGSADNWTLRTWPNMTTGQSRPDVTNSNKFWLKSAESVIQNDCSMYSRFRTWDIQQCCATTLF